MIMHNELKDAILLIFANKADMPNAREAEELAEMYGLNEIQQETGHEVNILPCCALTGDGLGEGLDWLADRLAAKMKHKNKNGDQRGLHVTKMPDNENRANLTDLTIRTSEFAMSQRNGGMNQSIEEQMDEESKGYDLRKKNDH